MLAALTNYGLATPEQIEIWKSLLDEWRDNPGASGAIAFRDCLPRLPSAIAFGEAIASKP